MSTQKGKQLNISSTYALCPFSGCPLSLSHATRMTIAYQLFFAIDFTVQDEEGYKNLSVREVVWPHIDRPKNKMPRNIAFELIPPNFRTVINQPGALQIFIDYSAHLPQQA